MAHGAITHGEAGHGNRSVEWKTWRHIIDRCGNPEKPYYVNVTICDEWRESYEAFLAHVGRRPTSKQTIDRIDNAKGYEPGNVRWATWKEQARNRNGNNRLTHNGETKTLIEWAESVGMAFHTLRSRLFRRRAGGMSLGEALSKPLRKKQPRRCKHCGSEDPKRFKVDRATECGACEKRMRDNGPCPDCGKPIRIGIGKLLPHCECGWRGELLKARSKDSRGRFSTRSREA